MTASLAVATQPVAIATILHDRGASVAVVTRQAAVATMTSEQGLAGRDGSVLSTEQVRIATGTDPVIVAERDRLIVLKGPGQVVLPANPESVCQVSVKDGGSVAIVGSIHIASASGALIDGAPNLTFTNQGQAATLTYVDGGWIIT